MNGQDTSAAHSALQYIISKALLEGKTGKTILQIPMMDLFAQYEGPSFNSEASGLVLKLEIITSWDKGSIEGDFDIEGEIDIDDDFIEDDDEGEKSGLN